MGGKWVGQAIRWSNYNRIGMVMVVARGAAH